MDLLEWGEKQRDRGVGLALDAQDRARPEFRDVALAALRRIASRQPTVHVNDLYEEIIERPTHPNAMGGIWREAANLETGFLVMTNETRKCIDPRKHAHRSPVYRSTIYRGRA